MGYETWNAVLEDEYGYPSCRECGYSFEEVSLESARALVDAAPSRYATLLRDTPHARRKPNPQTWSPSAYAWHLGEWLRIQAERVYAVMHDPLWDFDNWVPLDPDELDAVFHYDRLSVEGGLFALRQSADWFLAATEELDPARSFEHRTLGLRLTVLDLIRLVSHEVPHHELDIRRGLGLAKLGE